MHICTHACTHTHHSCQPLLGVNLSPEFVHQYFPYAGQILFFLFFLFFLLVAAAFWIPTGTCGSGRKKQCAKYICATSDLTSREILSLLHWASQCAFGDGVCWLHIQQFFNLFAIKQQQNLMKIMFSCIHFLIWPYPHKIKIKNCILYR